MAGTPIKPLRKAVFPVADALDVIHSAAART